MRVVVVVLAVLLCIASSFAAVVSDADLAKVAQTTMQTINDYRKSQSVGVLQIDASMTAHSKTHSTDMATGKTAFGHNGFTERFNLHPTAKSGAENVAVTSESDISKLPMEILNAWLNSAEHKTNLLDSKFTQTGLGVAQGQDGQFYFTQFFAQA
jgi:uncharacterized protein YkwD